MSTPSVQPILRSRLLPRISFRMVFFVTTVCAILAALARGAGNGGEFAMAMTVAAGFAVACLLLFLVYFLVAWCAAMFKQWTGIACLILAGTITFMEFSGLRLFEVTNWPLIAFLATASVFLIFVPQRDPDLLSDNPFAEGQLPPQILPPREKPL